MHFYLLLMRHKKYRKIKGKRQQKMKKNMKKTDFYQYCEPKGMSIK